MIENIRKYTGLMIVVLVLLFIGLVFLGDNVRGGLSGEAAMIVDKEKITVDKLRRLGANALRIPNELGYVPIPESGQKIAEKYLGDSVRNNPFLTSRQGILTYMTLPMGQEATRFMANRIAVQNEGLAYGVTAGQEEVETFIETVLFTDAEGKFDRKAYTEFLEEKLGGLGLDSRGFNHYIRDILTAQNLSNLIGGGLTSDPEIVRASHLNETQTITGQQISLVSTKFENDQNPTEEEIKTYWEENQANYNSDEKRSVSYIKIEPDWDATLADVEKKKVEAEEARKKAEAERKAKEEDAKEEKKKAERAAKKANEASAKEKEAREEPTPEVGKEAPAPETTDEEPEGTEGEEGEQGDPAPAPTETKEETPSTPVVPTPPPAPTTPAAPVTSPSPTATEITAVAPTTPKPNKVKPAAPAKPVTPPAPEKEKTAKEKLNGVQKRDAVKKLSPDANTVWQLAYDGAQDGKDFAATVKDGAKTLKNAKHTYVAAELFSKDDAPEALKARVTDAGIGTLADVIFKLPAKGAADEKISNPYRTDDGYFVIQLGEVIPSEPLSYEDAKVKATVDLKKQLAREALKKRAEEVHEKLAAGLKEGKTFEELAKAEELTVKPVAGASKPVVPAQYRSRGITFPTPPAFDAGKGANANSLAEIHFTPDEESPETALLVFVEKREFNEDEAFSSGLEEAIEGQNTNIRLMAFQAWLENQYMRNNVQVLQQPRH